MRVEMYGAFRRGWWLLLTGVVMTLLVVIAGAATGGVNDDGNPDIVFANYFEGQVDLTTDDVCVGDGAGGFACSGFNIVDGSQGLAVGDLDGDGDVDVVLASDGNRSRACLNDGNGIDYTCSDIPTLLAFDVALGDLDGDGDLDAVFAQIFVASEICLNDGDGDLSTCLPVEPNPSEFQAFAVDLGDLDGDGNLDAVFARERAPHQACLGDGAGTLSCSDLAVGGQFPFNDVELADVNNDGTLDAVFANSLENLLCLGDGTGALACDDLIDSEPHRSTGVSLGDVNGDGNMDAVFAGYNSPNRICLGDGSGGFSCASLVVGSSQIRDVDLGDLNGDGWVDLALADTRAANSLCFGDGTGAFPVCEALASPNTGAETTGVVIVEQRTEANEPPVITDVTGSADPTRIGTEAVVAATFSDANLDDTHTAIVEWGDGTVTSADVSFAEGSGAITDGHVYAAPGVYAVTVKVIDEGGLSDNDEYRYMVVYDPDGGFVTGGGWIDSPPGALSAEPAVEGKASFGFVSKYKKGATIPTGSTQFQFQAGDVNFHSTTYDWLVVTGANHAKFKGVGTINGAGEYQFQVWAGDSDPDTFRIKIWTTLTSGGEAVVYDNGMDQAIGQGSIVIHTANGR